MSERVVVITGANRGLGFATARDLAAAGHRVILTARTAEKARAAADRLAAEGLTVQPEACDVSDAASVAAFVARVLKDPGRVDVLINNAGVILEGHASGTLEVSRETIAQALNINTLGAWQLTQALLPGMNARSYGRVVNVSSGMGALSDMGSGYPAYRITKATLNVMTVLFSHAAAEGVKVNSVCPGWVRTDMGGPNANRSLAEGIAGIVWAATLPEDGPSGGFFRDGRRVDW
ncbi:MAG: SDR family NAD(P)-dependent oxidoreductase [Alphaproteobacteria bacterium]|nr:SDR family NAD(P)-dependent oxidoreductase [Alphaproteobacteria bacterium]